MQWLHTLWIPLALVALLFSAAEISAQGYYPGGYYEPYSYRDLARTGKYHGYWRDQGYGFRAQQNVFYPPYGGYYAPYYGGYNPLPPTGGGYYHPPANFPYQYRY